MGQHNNVKRQIFLCLNRWKVRKEIYKKIIISGVYVRKNQFHVHPREKNENKKVKFKAKKYKKKEMKKKYQ